MQKFFNKYIERRTGEELATWSSLNKTVYLLLPLVVYYIVGDLVEVIFWAVLDRILISGGDGTVDRAVLYAGNLNAIRYALGVMVILLCLQKMGKNEITYVIKNENPVVLKGFDVTSLVILGLSSSIFFNIILNISGLADVSKGFSEGYAGQMGVSFILGIAIYGILSPVVEEFLFRGIIYDRLRRMFDIRLSIILISLLFGVFHGNIVQGIYGFVMSLMITWCYELTRNIIGPLILHLVANTSIYAISHKLSGYKPDTVILIVIASVMGLIMAGEIFLFYKRHGKGKWK